MANVKDAATGTVLTAPVSATAGTSLVLNSGEGARFPTPPFYVVAHQNNLIPTASTAEKLLVTAKSTDTFTITRNIGSTFSNQSILVGWRISNAIFADDLNNASIIKNEVPGGSVNGSNTAYTVASAAKVTGTLEVYKNGVRMKNGGADFTETATGFTMVTAPITGTVLLCDYIVAGSLTNVGTNSFLVNETPTGSVNSSNTLYTAARAYIGGSLNVYLNGLKQRLTTDYAETSPAAGTFTMTTAPVTGDSIRIDYQYNLNPSSNADTVDGIHASTTASANQLLALDSNGKFPIDVIATDSGAWAAWTTTLSNITIGNGTVVARWKQVGKTADFRLQITFGSGTSISTGDTYFTLPANLHASYTAQYATSIGHGSIVRSAASYLIFVAPGSSAANAVLQSIGSSVGAAAAVKSTAPFSGWTTGDIIEVAGRYEVA